MHPLHHLLFLILATVITGLYPSDETYDPRTDPFLLKHGLDQRTLARVPFEGYADSTVVLRPEDELLADLPSRLTLHMPEDEKGGRGLLLMFDIDSGGRRNSDLVNPGTVGPRLHGIWSRCHGTRVNTCTTRVTFRPPGGSKGRPQPNRYVLVDFEEQRQQGAKIQLNFSMVTRRRFPVDLEAFMRDNRQLQPRACEFKGKQPRTMHVVERPNLRYILC